MTPALFLRERAKSAADQATVFILVSEADKSGAYLNGAGFR